MKKVIYYGDETFYQHLTNAKVYDVTWYSLSDNYFKVKVINDDDKDTLYMSFYSNPTFIDITSEYRNEVIDEILL